MLCRKCNAKIEKSMKRCPSCGEKIIPGCWFCTCGRIKCRSCLGYGKFATPDGGQTKITLRLASWKERRLPRITCPDCGGSGLDPEPCPVCMGTDHAIEHPITCPVCLGSGQEACRACDGTGKCSYECIDGFKPCRACDGKGCGECGCLGKQVCIDCSGRGCEHCRHTGLALCPGCRGTGRCTHCRGGTRPCPWCSPPERMVDLLELWYKGFHQMECQGDVQGIVFIHDIVLPHLHREQRRLILKYVENLLIPCGFPPAHMEDLKARHLAEAVN